METDDERVAEAMEVNPPDWARDYVNNDAANVCPNCEVWMQVVGAGKYECILCEHGAYISFGANGVTDV